MLKKSKIDELRERLIKEGKLRIADSPEFVMISLEFDEKIKDIKREYKLIEQQAWASAIKSFLTD